MSRPHSEHPVSEVSQGRLLKRASSSGGGSGSSSRRSFRFCRNVGGMPPRAAGAAQPKPAFEVGARLCQHSAYTARLWAVLRARLRWGRLGNLLRRARWAVRFRETYMMPRMVLRWVKRWDPML